MPDPKESVDRAMISIWGPGHQGLAPGEYARIASILEILFEQHAAEIRAYQDELVSVLSDFIENPKFDVAVGGKPIMTQALLSRTRAVLAKARRGNA